MICPNCGKEIIFKNNENTAACENCGCVLTISVTMQLPGKESSPGSCALEAETTPPGVLEEASASAPDSGTMQADAMKTAAVDSQDFEGKSDGKSESTAKKQLNIFGPAALALGILTIVFAFLAGLKALVLGIPALVVGALGLLACALLKNVKKRLPVAGLILSAAGIIVAVIIRTGLVF